MPRSKTSIYVDSGVWDRFRRYSRARGVEVSRMLETLMDDEDLDRYLGSLLKGAGDERDQLEFKPVEVKGGLASAEVRRMRDERSLSGQ